MANQRFSNELTDAQAERLAILLEEMGEAQQAVGKILRHGYESNNFDVPKAGWSNRHDLATELGDISAAIEMMCAAGDLQDAEILARAKEKLVKIKPYLHHQEIPA